MALSATTAWLALSLTVKGVSQRGVESWLGARREEWSGRWWWEMSGEAGRGGTPGGQGRKVRGDHGTRMKAG